MEIINILGKKAIKYRNLILVAETEEKVIKFYSECIEMDKKYEKTLKKTLFKKIRNLICS